MRIGTLRNKATVRRPTETRDEYADVAAGFVAGATFHLSIERQRSGMIDRGPGEQPSVTALGKARYGVDVNERDVLDVVSGPEVGSKWKVLAAFHPGARHTELVLEQFTGSLT